MYTINTLIYIRILLLIIKQIAQKDLPIKWLKPLTKRSSFATSALTYFKAFATSSCEFQWMCVCVDIFRDTCSCNAYRLHHFDVLFLHKLNNTHTILLTIRTETRLDFSIRLIPSAREDFLLCLSVVRWIS